MKNKNLVKDSVQPRAEPTGKKHPAGRGDVSVISLSDKRIVRSIFEEIGHTAAAYQDLRRQIFKQVAKSPKLQHIILDLLSRNAEAQKIVLQELARNPHLKRRFFVVADEKNKL